jgi:hypothetical protein
MGGRPERSAQACCCTYSVQVVVFSHQALYPAIGATFCIAPSTPSSWSVLFFFPLLPLDNTSYSFVRELQHIRHPEARGRMLPGSYLLLLFDPDRHLHQCTTHSSSGLLIEPPPNGNATSFFLNLNHREIFPRAYPLGLGGYLSASGAGRPEIAV